MYRTNTNPPGRARLEQSANPNYANRFLRDKALALCTGQPLLPCSLHTTLNILRENQPNLLLYTNRLAAPPIAARWWAPWTHGTWTRSASGSTASASAIRWTPSARTPSMATHCCPSRWTTCPRSSGSPSSRYAAPRPSVGSVPSDTPLTDHHRSRSPVTDLRYLILTVVDNQKVLAMSNIKAATSDYSLHTNITRVTTSQTLPVPYEHLI